MTVRAICSTPCGGYTDDEEIGLIFHSVEQLTAFLTERKCRVSLPYNASTSPPTTSRFATARVPPMLLQVFLQASELLMQNRVLMADFYPGWMPEGTPPEIEAGLRRLQMSHFSGYYGSIYCDHGLTWICWRDNTHYDHALFVSSQEGMLEAIGIAPVPERPTSGDLLTNARRQLPVSSRWANVELVGPMASLLVVHMRHVYKQVGSQSSI